MARQISTPDLENPFDITYISVPITNLNKARLIELAKAEGSDLGRYVAPFSNAVARGDLKMKPVWVME